MKKGKVMKALVMLVMLLASVAVSAQETAQPKSPAPQLEFVMQLNVSVGEAYAVGAVPQGHRQIIPITGGSFAGPLIRGEVLNGGADYQLSTDGGGRTQLEAIYSIRTDDGVNIHVRNMGLICNGKDAQGNASFYFRAAPRFEAPLDSKYAWLNDAIYVCVPSFGKTGTIILDVWKVK